MKIAIITGEHGFDEEKFDALFESMDDLEFVRMDLMDFVVDPNQDKYESIVFYNFHRKNPDSDTAQAILSLADRGQGLVILHHAILAFPDWEEFSDIVGVGESKHFRYYPDEKITVHVTDKSHPITSGIDDWEMVDETYVMEEPDEESHILLTVDNPKSAKAIGWTRDYRNSRVFCLQSGHDNQTYSVKQFRQVLYRGICWTAKQLS